MFFFFIITAILGGAIAGRALADGDGALAVLGLGIVIVSAIANGFTA